MRRITSIYLAGPEPWLPDAEGVAAEQRAHCELAGFVGLTPAALPIPPGAGELSARELYAARMQLMRNADAAVVNLTPFRGVSAHADAAFEAGVFSGLGKPVFGYLNLTDEGDAEYRDRVEAVVGGQPDEAGAWRDGDGVLIEDFGLPETLMLWSEMRRLFLIVTDDPLGDLTGLQLCLEALRLYAD
ncbi:MAG TPA: nucleoside 2-deoxyribosyltransferase [Caulobacteraceae bacterium]